MIFGAGGDLTGRYLLPALAQLEEAGQCPDLDIVALDRNEWDTDDFRAHARVRLDRHADERAPDALERAIDRLTYRRVDVTDADEVRAALGGGNEALVAYLALPPTVFGPAVEALGPVAGDRTRIVLEKPFGTSRASAQQLNQQLHRYFPEDSVFRMDHFLGKQTVQNLLGLRFANRVFEPLWCAAHIESIDIVWDETVALENRAGYYDKAGALLDMVQNHLLQLVALVGLERPQDLGPAALRDAKVDVLRRVTTPDIATQTRRARYTRGRVGIQEVPDYTTEPGVDPSGATETYAEVTLAIESERWEGVPFRLRTGKALAEARREIHIHFRGVDPLPFAPQDDLLANRLVMSMDPDTMTLDIALNGAGDPFHLEPARLELDLAPQELSPYARLLLDAFEGDPALSIRADEAEQSWRIVEPVVEAWRDGVVPLGTYRAGSTGPADSLVPPGH